MTMYPGETGWQESEQEGGALVKRKRTRKNPPCLVCCANSLPDLGYGEWRHSRHWVVLPCPLSPSFPLRLSCRRSRWLPQPLRTDRSRRQRTAGLCHGQKLALLFFVLFLRRNRCRTPRTVSLMAAPLAPMWPLLPTELPPSMARLSMVRVLCFFCLFGLKSGPKVLPLPSCTVPPPCMAPPSTELPPTLPATEVSGERKFLMD